MPKLKSNTSVDWCGLSEVDDMIGEIEIRESRPSDTASIEQLYPNAFPDEDLLPLLNELLRAEEGVLSLVAHAGHALAGHVVFTTCSIAGSGDTVSLLGPLAVAPDWQRQGVGGAIVRAGLEQLEKAGAAQVYVLGDPAYYQRFGFHPDGRVTPPYPLPDEWCGAWQSLSLSKSELHPQGKLSVPAPWRQRTLWAP